MVLKCNFNEKPIFSLKQCTKNLAITRFFWFPCILNFETALAWTLVLSLMKSVYLLFISTRKQTLNKVMSRRHVQNPRQSCSGVLFIFDLLLKTCSWIFFCSSFKIILSYLAKTDWIKRPMEHRQKRRETWRRWAEEIACINENNKGGWSTWGSRLERGITVCEAKGLKIRQGE